MDKQLLAVIAAILTALLETNGSPESMLYIFLDMNMERYSIVKQLLLQSKFIEIKANYVTLTELGKQKAEQINSKLNNAK